MNTPRRSASLLASLTLGAVLLTGCAEEAPQPKFAEEPSATPTPVEQEETAEEFIRRWAKAERDMQNTGQTAEYRAITEACNPCQQLADDMEDVYANGGWVKTEGMTITKVEPISKNTYRTRAVLAPTDYVTAQGQPQGRFDGGERTYVITLRKEGDAWQLATLLKDGAE